MGSANERRRCIATSSVIGSKYCNVFSHWLKPCPRDVTLRNCLPARNPRNTPLVAKTTLKTGPTSISYWIPWPLYVHSQTCSPVAGSAMISHLHRAQGQHMILMAVLSGQNGCQTADYICIYILVNKKFGILIKIALKFVPKGLIDNNPALVQIMAWRRIGAKPLS